MKIYDIRILKSTTGKEYIRFFFKTFRTSKRESEIKNFNNNMKLISQRRITDEEMTKYNDEEKFLKRLKMVKIIENDIGIHRTVLYKNKDICLYKLESSLEEEVTFKDKEILLEKKFCIDKKYIKYVIMRNSEGA